MTFYLLANDFINQPLVVILIVFLVVAIGLGAIVLSFLRVKKSKSNIAGQQVNLSKEKLSEINSFNSNDNKSQEKK